MGERPPLAGLRVVEVTDGVSAVGAGPAAGLPGALLRDLGADVVRVRPRVRSTLDAGTAPTAAWDAGTRVVEVEDPARTARELLPGTDVLLLSGPERRIEGAGLGHGALAREHPRLVTVRIRPGRDALGTLPDLEMLVHARTGLLGQIRGHRSGPVFGDLAVAATGAGLSAAVGALALLYEREATGRGGWAETSLHDGIRALLPMIIGRVEHHSPSTALLWREQGPAESLAYRCADGGYVQLWFGARGAYEEFLEHIGDPPSEKGYNADLMSGAMVERGRRWAARFAEHERVYWLERMAGHRFRCEPVLRPGEALSDPHVREVGLARDIADSAGGRTTVLGPVLSVTRVPGTGGNRETGRAEAAGPLLSGVRVLDLSAYLAGPIAPLVLAELGADVVKVEPRTGDAHRSMEPMFAAGQRGKRALALDLKAPGAPAVLDRLFRWADVVHHNSRVGASERLGYDAARVHAANPDAVYSFASGFGEHGPRATLPTNDQLMQALSGIEAGQGGAGRPPVFLSWGAVDVTGGWLAACGILAGLYARRREGGGRTVASSLLGAALTLKSGAHLRVTESGESVAVGGPELDADQTGYGAAYRLYRGSDGAWFALAVTDAGAWGRLRGVVGDRAGELPADPPPLRTAPTGPQPAEKVLERAFATRTAADWTAALRAADVPVEPVVEVDRSAFAAGLLDDPVRRSLGDAVSHIWGERGLVEQLRFPPRLGSTAVPAPRPAPAAIPGLGEHTADLLAELGLDAAALAASETTGGPRP